jgi:hypothetical protein
MKMAKIWINFIGKVSLKARTSCRSSITNVQTIGLDDMLVTNLGLDGSSRGSRYLQEVHLIAVGTAVKASLVISNEDFDVITIFNDHRAFPVVVNEDIVDPQMRFCGMSDVDVFNVQDSKE